MRETRGSGRLGLLVPFTNTNLEPDFALMCPDGISVHTARLGGYDEDEIPDETQMQGLGASDLEGPLTLLMGAKPDVVIYGCTSATLTHGPAFDRALAERIAHAHSAQAVTAAGAIVHALQRMGATRIGFASPYVPAINEMAVRFLSDQGVETVAQAQVHDTLSNEGQGNVSPDEVFALGQQADHPNAEAIVLSCTDMRSVEIIERLEANLGKPVITSNQAMLFQALEGLGHRQGVKGFGRLLAGLGA